MTKVPFDVVLSDHGAMQNLIEGQARGPGFKTTVHNTRWSAPGAGIFTSPSFFVQMFLSRETVVGATYDPPKGAADYRPLGDVGFVTGDAPLYCRWRRGRQRSISCALDMKAIAERWEIDWTWPGFDPALSLSAGSHQVRIEMRRIAEEVLAPGFASAARIEAALVSVAIDLHRCVKATKAEIGPSSHALSARNLAVIRSMLLDMNGPGPTVPELATACGLSARALTDSYKRSTGMTLRQFMSESRLERARTLLGSSRAPIKQIAYQSGFGSSSAFVAAFRQAIGITPAAYRDLGDARTLS